MGGGGGGGGGVRGNGGGGGAVDEPALGAELVAGGWSSCRRRTTPTTNRAKISLRWGGAQMEPGVQLRPPAACTVEKKKGNGTGGEAVAATAVERGGSGGAPAP